MSILPETSVTVGSEQSFDYESIVPGYYDAVFQRHKGIQSKWHHLKFRRVAAELHAYYRVLDVGCGPGTFLGVFRPGISSVGIDLSPQQIEFAKRQYGSGDISFLAETVSSLPEEIGTFDAVTAIELIEHLGPPEVDEILRAALDRLRPGGKLVLTTPNFRSLWPLVELGVNRLGPVPYEMQHTNKFTPVRLTELLLELGLVDVKVEPFIFLAPFAAGLSWRIADVVAEMERGAPERNFGMLLLGSGIKPA